MLNKLKPVIYLQISADRLTIKNLKSGETIAEIPEMAISTSPAPSVLAVGPQSRAAAASQGARIVNPFTHPRSLVSDFTIGELVLKYYLHRILPRTFLRLAPVVIVHPLGSPAGGFTQIECRAFREMALGAGASKVFVWTGRALTDQEALALDFPPGEGEVA